MAGDGKVVPLRARGRIADARRYRPRGQTLREAAEERSRRAHPAAKPRAAETPAPRLRVLDGGAAARTISKPRQPKPRQPKPPPPRHRRRPAPPSKSKPEPKQRVKRPRRSRRSKHRASRLANPLRRLRVSTLIIFVLFALIAGRLVELQLTDANAYAAAALKQRLTEVVLHAPRGAILDRNGAVLAHSLEARYVYADPVMIDDVGAAADKLSPVLGIPRSELLTKLQRRNRSDGRPLRFEYLARGVGIEVGDAVRALNLKGVKVGYDERREAPGHDLAANVLGFTGRDGSGLAGLEARYDKVLRGVDGARAFEIGRNDREIPDGYHHERAPRPGQSVKLTLDRDLQYEVQRSLTGRMRSVGATFGAAVVLDIKTGEVLALASYPTFDAANPFAVPSTARMDYGTAAVVEPGSVHKAIVMAGALQEGVIKPDSTPLVPPTIRKGGRTFKDTHPHPTRRMTIPGILAHSSNVGTIQIAEQLGPDRLYKYQRAFGLGERTGVLPGEAGGLVQPPDRWSGPSHGSIPIGLGVAVTPLQMASVYAAIANDGVWMQPHLVRPADGPRQREAVAPEHARALRQMLEAVVVGEGATGRRAAIPGYRVAGKTGTGLRVLNNRYAPGNVASFVGFAPAENPRYAVAVFGHAGGAGGVVSGPVFKDIMSFTLRHYRIPPTGTKPPTFKIYA